ncbi:hypothetical protein Zmor_001433 [Zophobas morio]|uniref:Uncharacterized protein n=1 Tax=Zophobas morio TaxID=2755281 RepID=A0AA38J2N9_9CUCU|nr:hypothetical protein Zmor_001433 [Zophobas morio]
MGTVKDMECWAVCSCYFKKSQCKCTFAVIMIDMFEKTVKLTLIYINLFNMPAVSIFNRSRAIALIQSGMSQQQVSVTLAIENSTVNLIVQKCRREQTWNVVQAQ